MSDPGHSAVVVVSRPCPRCGDPVGEPDPACGVCGGHGIVLERVRPELAAQRPVRSQPPTAP